MHIPQNKYFNRSFVKSNLLYGALGAAVGLIITLFESVINAKIIPPDNIIANLIFSTVITLSITNSIYFFACFWRSENKGAWQFILIYYGGNILGTLIGIEISYLIVSFIYNAPYHFLNHFSDYRFSLLIVVVVSTIVYFYMTQREKMKAKLAEKELDLVKLQQLKTQAELQTLQSKINPHFLYNSLNSIAGLVHVDANKAEDMTLKLSRLFRYSVNSPQGNTATVKQEMEIVETYLDIEKVRFGDRLNFSTQVSRGAGNAMIPRFLIQPLVENALKHGLNDKVADGELLVNVEIDGKYILIKIADNGKPFPAELSVGYGLLSTYDKLTLLYGDDYEVQLINVPQKQICIKIPAVYE
jgi:two-component system LytT family sensor kinase